MAKALPAGPIHRRALFGALDADGWTWATLKALFWFFAIIMLLGYIPDRAYYFTVQKTIDLGIMVWSPINLCPAENGGLPCPAPEGAVEPWQSSPSQLAFPEARIDGSAAQLGSTILYIGGSNGSAATNTTFTTAFANGNFAAWAAGPQLPDARSRAGVAVLNGSAYLIGGDGPDGKPTNTVWQLASDPTSGALSSWKPVDGVTLPEARSGAAVIAMSDGILVAGGTGPDGKPSTSVWKTTADSNGKLGAFTQMPDLQDGVSDAASALDGTFVWVYGGTDANGPTNLVQRGAIGKPGSSPAAGASAGASGAPAASGGAAAAPSPAASGAPQPDVILQWGSENSAAPPARTGAAGWTANGAIYLAGGSDGKSVQGGMYWALPDADGGLSDGWHHLDVADLPSGGVQGGSALVSGATVFIFGGATPGASGAAAGTASAGSLRADLAPQEPFFQLGIAGATIPALEIPGETGQQLGYLSAAGAGTLDFIILVIIGWAFAHRPQIGAWWERRRAARRAAERVRTA